tara:strand:- start:1467 stop:1658 length:192 start_codon:yes stop_codon:yes gene_type:complete
MTNIHLRTLMRPAQLVWATPGMMMILDDDVEEEDNFYINCYKLPSSLESKQLDIGPPLRVVTM